MTEPIAAWKTVDYERFEIHVSAIPLNPPDPLNALNASTAPRAADTRYTYVGYVCHPGADPALPGHTVPFHADGEERFASAADAYDEAVHVGRSIVDGTHPDLSVLPLVTGGV